jgi:hypothetical protein
LNKIVGIGYGVGLKQTSFNEQFLKIKDVGKMVSNMVNRLLKARLDVKFTYILSKGFVQKFSSY